MQDGLEERPVWGSFLMTESGCMDFISGKLRTFFASRIKGVSLSDEDDVFARGYVNSLFLIQLVMFVEAEFGIHVEGPDLVLDNFRSIRMLSRFVAEKRTNDPASEIAS
jgi:methoxymalonate biosynthesis acyl carrier protein